MIIYPEQGAGKGKTFTEADQYGLVDLSRRFNDKSGNQKTAAQGCYA